MSIKTINDNHLTNIGNAIRNKNGTDIKYKPSEMAGGINALEVVHDYIDTSLIETNKSVNYLTIRLVTKLPYMDTSEVTNMSYMYSRFSSLDNLQELECSKVVNVNAMFASCASLVTFGGLKDLGKAYLTTATANYANYTLNLNNTNLNHESLMNVINGLYDIASLGVQNQSLVLGNELLAKLSEEEIAIATAKGWNVS